MKAHHSLTNSILLAGALTIATSAVFAEGGFLGIQVGAPSDALRAQLGISAGFGLVVESLPKDSPANKSGLEASDILLEMDGQKIINQDQLVVLLNHYNPSDKVDLLLIRDGENKNVTITLGERPDLSQQIEKLEPQATAEAETTSQSTSKNTSNSISIVNGIPTQSTATMNDGTHQLIVKNNGGRRHLTAWASEGEEIFSGPIETEEELKAVPKDIRSKIPKVVDTNSIIINKVPLKKKE